MKNLTVYLPSAKLIVGVLVVLAVLTLAWKYASSNPTVAKVLAFFGWM